MGIKLVSDTLQPVQEVLDLCSQKLTALKNSKAKGDQATSKQKNRAYDRFMDSFASHKASFVESAQSLLQAELKCSLTQQVTFGGVCTFCSLMGLLFLVEFKRAKMRVGFDSFELALLCLQDVRLQSSVQQLPGFGAKRW